MKINLDVTPDVFFVSDTHFGHKAMANHWRRRGDGEKFASIDEMDEHLIDHWNSTVPPYGIVFHLGDVSFRNQKETLTILTRLNGEIHLVPGNHDKGINGATRSLFRTINPYLELDIRGAPLATAVKAVLCHYALRSWNGMHYGAWNLHGHSHGNLVPCGRQLDVGVDCHLVTADLRPIHIAAVANWMAAQRFVAVDHHYQRGDAEFDKNTWTQEVASAQDHSQ